MPFSYLDGDQKAIGYAVDICMRIVDAAKRELKVYVQLAVAITRSKDPSAYMISEETLSRKWFESPVPPQRPQFEDSDISGFAQGIYTSVRQPGPGKLRALRARGTEDRRPRNRPFREPA